MNRYRILILAIALAGCGQSVQIVRAPLISPVVIPVNPPPHPFLMNAAVKNYSASETSPDLWLKIYSEYWSTASPKPGQPPCTQTDWVHVGVLAPSQSWGLADYRIDRNSDCACVKDACPGHVWIDLHVAKDYAPHISGTDTALHVNWVASGDLAHETVTNF
jgi:hypothetical protein